MTVRYFDRYFLIAVVATTLLDTSCTCRDMVSPTSRPSLPVVTQRTCFAGHFISGRSFVVMIEASGATGMNWFNLEQYVLDAMKSAPPDVLFSVSVARSGVYTTAWPQMCPVSPDVLAKADSFLGHLGTFHGEPNNLLALRSARSVNPECIVYFCAVVDDDVCQTAREMPKDGQQKLWLICPASTKVDADTIASIGATGGGIIFLGEWQ
jgi:hypothetical protein